MDKELKIDELFCGMPELFQYFQGVKKTIRAFHLTNYKNLTTKEEFEQFHEKLLQTAQGLRIKDLVCVFFLRNIDGINLTEILRILHKRYQEQLTFQKMIKGDD